MEAAVSAVNGQLFILKNGFGGRTQPKPIKAETVFIELTVI